MFSDCRDVKCCVLFMLFNIGFSESIIHFCFLFYQVGMFKIHPEIPESLSSEAKSFILSCFEPDPNKRATAGDLLKDLFLRQNIKGKKSKIAFKPSGNVSYQV